MNNKLSSEAYRSSETYRSFIEHREQSLKIDGGNPLQKDKQILRKTSSRSETGNPNYGSTPVPPNWEMVVPNSPTLRAVLRGPPSTVFDAVGSCLRAGNPLGVTVLKTRKEKGKYTCLLDEGLSQEKFKIVFWAIPEDNKMMMELIVYSSDSNKSWPDLFYQLCNHAAVKPYVLSQPQALNSDITPIGQFVKPVLV